MFMERAPDDLSDFGPGYIEYRDEKEMLRGERERFRNAALLGYGAILARNSDGQLDQVLKAMDAILWPEPHQQP